MSTFIIKYWLSLHTTTQFRLHRITEDSWVLYGSHILDGGSIQNRGTQVPPTGNQEGVPVVGLLPIRHFSPAL